MSDTGSRSNPTDKIKFLEIDAESEPLKEEHEYFSDRELDAEGPSRAQTGEIDLPQAEPAEQDPRAGELKAQVDDIAKRSQEESLTNDQVEILKKYISLKEAEVRDLRDQHRQYQAFVKKISTQVERLQNKTRELTSDLELAKQHEGSLKAELVAVKEKAQQDLARLKNDYDEKARQSGHYESEMNDLVRKKEEWKEKIREDLRRIKLKERELENKYELLKRDTQALLDSKDKHVLELKKKNDALELELESFEERLRKTNAVLQNVDARKLRLTETLKLALSLLDGLDAEGSLKGADFETMDGKGRKTG